MNSNIHMTDNAGKQPLMSSTCYNQFKTIKHFPYHQRRVIVVKLNFKKLTFAILKLVDVQFLLHNNHSQLYCYDQFKIEQIVKRSIVHPQCFIEFKVLCCISNKISNPTYNLIGKAIYCSSSVQLAQYMKILFFFFSIFYSCLQFFLFNSDLETNEFTQYNDLIH